MTKKISRFCSNTPVVAIMMCMLAWSPLVTNADPFPSDGGASSDILPMSVGSGVGGQHGFPGDDVRSMRRGAPTDFEVRRPTTPTLTAAEIQKGQQSAYAAYVRDVAGVSLPVFGNDLFQSALTTFAPLDAAQVNGDYALGSGDQILVRVWGVPEAESIDQVVTIDRSGSAYLPHVGAVHLAGVKYRDLQETLKKEIGRVLANFGLSATMAQTRAVQVYVVGNAVRPGTYTLSAMSTLLNALFSSGGPSGTGSMRDIQLKRGGTVVTRFDMYNMLVNGDKSQDASLQDGDVIYIGAVGSQIALFGNVKRPALYEFKESESLNDALRWAGGLANSVASNDIIIQRNSDNKYQTIVELKPTEESINARLSQQLLTSASIIRVFSPGAAAVALHTEREFVTLSGETKRTGVFQIDRGETLRDFMARIGGVNEYGYVFGMQLTRDEVRRIQQERLDAITDRLDSEIDTAAKRRLSGLTDRDAIGALQTEIASEHASVQKMRMIKAPGRIVLGLPGMRTRVMDLPEMPLRDGDTIFVPRRPDTVDVYGAVNQQGTFVYKDYNATMDYVKMAGGLTEDGDKSGIFILRADGSVEANSSWFVGMGSAQINPGDSIVVPQKIVRTDFVNSLKEWTTILYQFGLGAAGLKVLK